MKNKFVIAIIVFLVWIAITMLGPKFQLGWDERPLDDLVSHAVALWLVVDVIFLLAVVAFFGWWKQVGLRAADPSGSWLYVWFPALLILLIIGLTALSGFPPTSVVLFVLFNTFLVGISEELMTRGVLLYGALTRFGIWSSVVIVSLIFGGMHLLNGFNTGDFTAASVQSVAAAMSGLMFMALRLRTNSLYPGIIIHGLWDFSVFVLQLALKPLAGSGTPAEPTTAQLVIFPLFIALPSFLYGLWLLRHIGEHKSEEFISA